MLTYLLYIFQALLLLLLNIPASVQFHFVNTCTHRRSTRHDFVGIFGLRLGSLIVQRSRFSRHGESDRDCVGSFGRLRDAFRAELRVDGGLWRRQRRHRRRRHGFYARITQMVSTAQLRCGDMDI